MKINRILITGRLYAELEPILINARLDAELRCKAETNVTEADLAWADAYVGFRPVPGFHTEGLQWVHALGAGVDAFIHKKIWNRGVLLTRTTGDFGRKIAAYTLSHMLADVQLHQIFAAQQASREWSPIAPASLDGQRAVVFGTGSIGQEVARTLQAFGLHVTGISSRGASKPGFRHVIPVQQAAAVLPHSDWVINTLPLTTQTERLFDDSLFARMSGCGFIQVGRGASVDTDAMLRALDAGRVRLAVLDVFEQEPLPPDSPLWTRRDVRITPHISAVTSVEEAAEGFLRTWQRIRQGSLTELPNRVDPERGY